MLCVAVLCFYTNALVASHTHLLKKQIKKNCLKTEDLDLYCLFRKRQIERKRETETERDTHRARERERERVGWLML